MTADTGRLRTTAGPRRRVEGIVGALEESGKLGNTTSSSHPITATTSAHRVSLGEGTAYEGTSGSALGASPASPPPKGGLRAQHRPRAHLRGPRRCLHARRRRAILAPCWTGRLQRRYRPSPPSSGELQLRLERLRYRGVRRATTLRQALNARRSCTTPRRPHPDGLQNTDGPVANALERRLRALAACSGTRVREAEDAP